MKKFAIVFLFSFILTVIFTWPLLLRIPTPISKHPDYNFGGFTYWYNQNALVTGKIFHPEDYFNGFNEFYPQPYVLGYSDITPIPSLIFAPIFWLSKQYFFSLNFYIFFCLILSIVSTYYCINYLVKNSLASLLGAVIYTFNPLTFGHFPEHVDLLNKYFLPPLFLTGLLFFQKPKLQSSLLFLLFFLLNALSALYFQLYSIFFLPIIFLPIFYINYKKPSYLLNLFKFGSIFLILIPPLLFFNSPYLQTSSKEAVQRTLDETIHFSSRLVDYFTSTTESFLYGSLAKELDPELNNLDPAGVTVIEEEHTMALNILPFVLFLFSFAYLLKKESLWKELEDNFSYSRLFKNLLKLLVRAPYIYYYLLLFLSFILTFGPYFMGWIGYSGDLKLPYYYLYQYIPFIKGMRVPTRFEFIFYIPFALFCSFGALYLLDKPKKSAYIIFAILLTVLFFENYNIKPLSDDTGNSQKILSESTNPALNFLHTQKTLHLPIFSPYIGGNAIYLLSAINLDDRFANGYSGYFPQDQLNHLDKWKKSLDTDAFKELLSLNIRYIIIHKELLDKEYTDSLNRNSDLYKNGIVYDDSSTRVLDLNKFNLNPKICSFDKDIDKSLSQDSGGLFTLTIKNNKDCYLPSILNDRYKSIDVYLTLIKHTASFKMPILVDPGEQVVFSQQGGDLNIN